MTPSIPALAAGLSEAQRKAVIGAKPGLVAGYFWFEPMHLATRKALQRKGLSMFNCKPDRLSPLGLALREYLEVRDG